MSEPELLNEFMPYPETLLDAWKNGDYSMLKNSKASGYIKKILVHKTKLRPVKGYGVRHK